MRTDLSHIIKDKQHKGKLWTLSAPLLSASLGGIAATLGLAIASKDICLGIGPSRH